MRAKFIIPFSIFIVKAISQNNLRLYTSSGEIFKVFCEDSVVNENEQANVLIENIKKDTVHVKVVFQNKTSATQTIFLLDKGEKTNRTEFSYIIEVKNEKIKFYFTGTQMINKLPDPLVPVKPVIDTMAKYRNKLLGHYCEMKDGKPIYFNNLPKKGECLEPMPDVYLKYMALLMNKTQVEDDKFVIAENTIRNNCLNVAQLNQILEYILFEIEKLKIIRLAYFQLTDKQNRSELTSTFKLESSKKELNEFFKNINEYKINTGNNCTTPMSESNFNELYSKLSVYNIDVEKYSNLKKVYTDNCYSLNQARMLVGLFIHDRERLDASKMLYFYCTEKKDFEKISEVYSYTTSKAELIEFLDKQNN